MPSLLLPRLPADPTPSQALDWYERVAWAIGLGFHPDTPAHDYVTADGARSLSDEDADALDGDLAQAWPLIRRGEMDLYDVACRLWWRMHYGLPREENPEDPRVRVLSELQRLDPNGVFTDEDSFSEWKSPLSIEAAVHAREQILASA